MLLFVFSSNVTPRIFFATRPSRQWLSRNTVRLYRMMVKLAQGPRKPRSIGRMSEAISGDSTADCGFDPACRYSHAGYASSQSRAQMRVERALGGEQAVGNVRLALVEPLGRHRHRNGDGVAEQVARHHAGGADAERVLLAVKGDAALAHETEIFEQPVEAGERLGRAPLVGGADQLFDGGAVQFGQIGLAVGRAVEGEHL